MQNPPTTTHRPTTKLFAAALIALPVFLSSTGCMLDPITLAQSAYVSAAYPEYSEANMYAPGGILADKHVGPMALNGATDASISSLVPDGANKTQVRQTFGTPFTSSTNHDGTSSDVFTHSFTSYRNKIVQTQTLTVDYDASNIVNKKTLSHSNSSW